MKSASFIFSNLFFIVLLFAACNQPNPHQKEIDGIDSLFTELSIIDSILASTDTASMRSKLQGQLEHINFIQQNIDTMDRKTAFLLDRYAQYKKAHSKWGQKIGSFFEESALRKNQLQDLKNDLENELLDDMSVQVYYSGESVNILQLKQIVNQMDSGLRTITPYYEETHQEVLEIVEELRDSKDL